MKLSCNICYGDGIISNCCGKPVDETSNGRHQCGGCMLFCRVDYCDHCDFLDNIKEGDEIDIFLCIYSPKRLTKYKPFNIDNYEYGDTRYETVTFIKAVNSYQLMVRHPKMKKNIKIDVEDISI